MIEELQKFEADWASPPGDTISDILEERRWKQNELATRLGCSDKHVNQLIKGKVPLTGELARRLALVFGTSESFWLRREARYREQLLQIETLKFCEQHVDWLANFPIPELKKAEILPNEPTIKARKPRIVRRLLEFFGVSSPQQWHEKYAAMQVNFRRSNNEDVNLGAITAWLRLGEIAVERLERENLAAGDEVGFNAKKFEDSLLSIRGLTVLKPSEFQKAMIRECRKAGVFLIFTPSIPKARVSGVARWLSNRPVIQLSLYGKFNDRFWFTFFHESAHLLLHSDEKSHIFLDNGQKNNTEEQQESEANQWAEEILIPPEFNHKLLALNSINDVKKFSKIIGIHPGIVVGRLQKEKVISFREMNRLKVQYELRKKSNSPASK